MNYQSILAPKDFQPQIVHDLPEEQYHADKTAVGSSHIRLAVDSPKSFLWGFFKGHQKEQTQQMRLGKIVHMALLEGDKFKQSYIVEPEFWGLTQDGKESKQSKEAKIKKAKWYADLPPGRIVVTQEDLEVIEGSVESVLSHPDAKNCFKNGSPEVSGYYVDEATGIKVKWRSDYLAANGQLLNDLKTARTAKRIRFGSQAFELRYDIQMVVYREGIKAMFGSYPEINTLTVVEQKWPYECAVYHFQKEDLFAAEHDYRKGLDTIKQCIDSGVWPMRQKSIERIYTPTWFINEAVDQEESELNEEVTHE